jgi:adenylylsulfate kinase
MTGRNITRHRGHVDAAGRAERLGQAGAVVWLTGLSGSGKSTVAYAVEAALVGAGRIAYVLDGDNLRTGLCADLGFSPEDRHENVRRVGAVAALLADAGVIAITSLISPYRAGRAAARAVAPAGRFVEVFVDVPLAVCEGRDPKGLYQRARRGEIAEFSGVSAPYEPPEAPELTLDTEALSPEACAERVIAHLRERGFLGSTLTGSP